MSALGVGWEGCGGTPLVMSVLGVGWEGCSSAPLVMSALGVSWEDCRMNVFAIPGLDDLSFPF